MLSWKMASPDGNNVRLIWCIWLANMFTQSLAVIRLSMMTLGPAENYKITVQIMREQSLCFTVGGNHFAWYVCEGVL